MSETEPLLDPIASYSTAHDPEAPDAADMHSACPLARWRAKTARALESRVLHQTVIALVRRAAGAHRQGYLTDMCADRHRRVVCARRPDVHPPLRDVSAYPHPPPLRAHLTAHSCTPTEGPEAPLWLAVLSYISLAITSAFVLELPATLWALGPSAYDPRGPVPHAGLHLFDAAVVLTTFVLEVGLNGRERELAGLLVLLRLWRLVKLVGGARAVLPRPRPAC
jgi:hypothetical protein